MSNVNRTAETYEELKEAYALVYRNYLERRYCTPHPSLMRYTLHNASPDAITFVSMADDTITGTVSVIADSPLGLPCESGFPVEIDSLRDSGRWVAEAVSLSNGRPNDLFKLVFGYCKYLRVDDILVTCHPEHAPFYKGYLKFKQISNKHMLASVNNNPAVLLRLDMSCTDEIAREYSMLRKQFVDDPISTLVYDRRFRHTTGTFEDLFVYKRELLKEATAKEVRYLAACYPEIAVYNIIKLAWGL